MAEGATLESTPAETATADPGQAAVTTTGTPEGQNGQAIGTEKSAPVEDQFSNIDPNTLPPELQGVYKNLQADYTRKTQAIAEARKKADLFDQISRDQNFVNYWNGLSRQEKADFKEQKAAAEKSLGESISDEDFAKAFNSKQDFLSFMERIVEQKNANAQRKIADLEQKLSVQEARNLVEAFATETGQDGKPMRPDFDALDEDQLITGYLNVNPPTQHTEQAYRAKLNEAYSWAKGVSQKYYEKGKREALQIIQKKAASSSEMPTTSAKGAYTGPNPKKITPREALEMAKRGEKVPQVYD